MLSHNTARGGLWGGRLRKFAVLQSTNTWALTHAAELEHGDVIWAVRQTAGRGRLGRQWWTPGDRSLAVSVILRDQRLAGLAANLGQVAAWAVWETLAGMGIRAQLKWPNDVLVDGAKIAGILVEAGESDFWVVGIGLNVNVTARELAAAALGCPATSLRILTGRARSVGRVLMALLAAFRSCLETVVARGMEPLLTAWARADALAGAVVEVRTAGGNLRGRYLGLDQDGRLRLADAAGREERLWSGDVTRVAPHAAKRPGRCG